MERNDREILSLIEEMVKKGIEEMMVAESNIWMSILRRRGIDTICWTWGLFKEVARLRLWKYYLVRRTPKISSISCCAISNMSLCKQGEKLLKRKLAGFESLFSEQHHPIAQEVKP